MVKGKMQDAITGKEKLSYGIFSIGQTIFYSVIALMTTYFTDVGITPAAVAVSREEAEFCGYHVVYNAKKLLGQKEDL